ncbi:flotillin family protein [Candidatus Dependentiae bacterium]|nr:flotillin family protein [Candidatus Dependentiae bacterium]
MVLTMISPAMLSIIAAVTGLLTLVFVASRYKRCPSNKILAVFGKVQGNSFVQCIHGGGAFVWPLIQDYAFLDLTPRTIHIPLKSALSLQNIRINVPSTFTIAIDTSPECMNNAAIRLLGLSNQEIELMAVEIITGQMRLTVASLTIEQINQDRESFLSAIKNHIDPELNKVGLSLINVNITDITDESHYIESIGKKAASLAVNQAKIDVAEAERRGESGRADAEKERRISVATYNAQAVEGENEAQARIASFNADLAQKKAEYTTKAEVAEQTAYAHIQHAKAQAELKRLEAEQIVPKEIEKRKIAIDAEATAEKMRREAIGQAEAILSIRNAEAEGIQKTLDAKAEGYTRLIKACGNDAQAAATMLMVEKLEQIVSLQTEAIKNIKIDKITVWDSGSGDKGSSTANFMSNMAKSLPPLHEVAAMAGINLPQYLGQLNPETNTATAKTEHKQAKKEKELA